jgi:hypothetical protein
VTLSHLRARIRFVGMYIGELLGSPAEGMFIYLIVAYNHARYMRDISTCISFRDICYMFNDSPTVVSA